MCCCLLKFRSPRAAVVCVAVLNLIGVAGCGGSDLMAVYPTEAKLLLGEESFGPTRISLVPLKEGGRTVAGEVDEQGNVKFTTYEVGDGAPAGEYRVVVGLVMAPPPKPFPAIYRQYKESPLRVTVEEKDLNELTITMDPKAGPLVRPNPMAAGMQKAMQDAAITPGAKSDE